MEGRLEITPLPHPPPPMPRDNSYGGVSVPLEEGGSNMDVVMYGRAAEVFDGNREVVEAVSQLGWLREDSTPSKAEVDEWWLQWEAALSAGGVNAGRWVVVEDSKGDGNASVLEPGDGGDFDFTIDLTVTTIVTIASSSTFNNKNPITTVVSNAICEFETSIVRVIGTSRQALSFARFAHRHGALVISEPNVLDQGNRASQECRKENVGGKWKDKGKGVFHENRTESDSDSGDDFDYRPPCKKRQILSDEVAGCSHWVQGEVPSALRDLSMVKRQRSRWRLSPMGGFFRFLGWMTGKGCKSKDRSLKCRPRIPSLEDVGRRKRRSTSSTSSFSNGESECDEGRGSDKSSGAEQVMLNVSEKGEGHNRGVKRESDSSDGEGKRHKKGCDQDFESLEIAALREGFLRIGWDKPEQCMDGTGMSCESGNICTNASMEGVSDNMGANQIMEYHQAESLRKEMGRAFWTQLIRWVAKCLNIDLNHCGVPQQPPQEP
ncbi:hypothetical protein Vadar_025076 [Vaccinium darrowii]|uniref:Uncharacterized protein n=1 Tax=Vaccinium darrowii TaxID=229202 RepID=A0ACB7X3J9_9ERIC|nr:hypothetical protein Vadar_025076 [Vaccinium darrowii]